MRNYYPIDDMEEIDLDFLLKRWRANQLFPNLLIIEILEVLAFAVIENRQLTYSYFYGSDIDYGFIRKNCFDGEINKTKFKGGEFYISICGFHKIECPDIQDHVHHYHAWGSIRCEKDNPDISSHNLGFNSRPIDDIFVSKADVIAFESGNFEPYAITGYKESNLGLTERRIKKIINVTNNLHIDPMNIPEGNKQKIKAKCLKDTQLFNSSGFDRAWKEATNPKKDGNAQVIRMKDKEKYL